MEFPNARKYSQEHECISLRDEASTINLPNVGQSFQHNEVFSSVEALKAVSDLFMPVSGKIAETSEHFFKEPTQNNAESFGNSSTQYKQIYKPATRCNQN